MSDLESRIASLESAIAQLTDELANERRINSEQAEQLLQRQQRLNAQQRANRQWIEAIAAGGLGFLGFLLVVLMGLRLEFGWGSFAMPSGILESSAVAAGASVLYKYVSDKQKAQG